MGVMKGVGWWEMMFCFCCNEGERASSRYRSTSPVRSTDRVFDCGKRLVRVDGQVWGLMYVSCYCAPREELRVYIWCLFRLLMG